MFNFKCWIEKKNNLKMSIIPVLPALPPWRDSPVRCTTPGKPGLGQGCDMSSLCCDLINIPEAETFKKSLLITVWARELKRKFPGFSFRNN